MKNALLILILTFGILSCNAQTQREKEERIRSKINTEFDQNSSNCSDGTDVLTPVKQE